MSLKSVLNLQLTNHVYLEHTFLKDKENSELRET